MMSPLAAVHPLLLFVYFFTFIIHSVEAINETDVRNAVDRLDDYIQTVLTQTGVPSIAAAVVYNDSVVYSNAFGIRTVGSNESVTPETVYQLASLSKSISSTIVAGLVSDGYLKWTSHANDLDPLIELSDPWITREVTVEDFFCHRSGLYGGAGDDIETFGYNRSEILPKLKYLAPTGSFRVAYQYSNYGVTCGAEAAASAAGGSWEDLAKSRLYERCNMSSTSSLNADFMQESNRASLHVLPPNITDANLTEPYIKAPLRDPDAQAPAGGVTSNVLDLAQWLRLVLGNGTYNGEAVINSTNILYAHQPQIVRGLDPATGMPGYYGLGWTVDYEAPNSGRIFIGHAGAFSSGTRSIARLNIADGLGIVVLSNCFPTGTPDAVAFAFMDWVYHGNETRDWLGFWDPLYNELNMQISGTDPGFDVSPSSSGNSSGGPLPGPAVYAGVYSNDYVGRVNITATDSTSNRNLTLDIGSRSLPLTYWDSNVYVMRAVVEAPEAPSAVTFVLGPGGEAMQVIIDSLNGDGGGVLDRES
ncbi:uncharacterized protein A1O9_01062 [Exophiala aquamarina CBS 119918]|uniref:Beta-lactamase-related domain-containing protein n=1 Tax=Exophiala aquamarina CBS 119918 TaxID=1182545 RepID=A0A072PT78_9EURO|nr:uncharacterized protein A1O9_01062 [Exophiala aquamarina CBS 119918]KEF63086.1 hypothetical protein A1O9_01062 [Exophiala aquamarina CBS 119918]